MTEEDQILLSSLGGDQYQLFQETDIESFIEEVTSTSSTSSDSPPSPLSPSPFIPPPYSSMISPPGFDQNSSDPVFFAPLVPVSPKLRGIDPQLLERFSLPPPLPPLTVPDPPQPAVDFSQFVVDETVESAEDLEDEQFQKVVAFCKQVQAELENGGTSETQVEGTSDGPKVGTKRKRTPSNSQLPTPPPTPPKKRGRPRKVQPPPAPLYTDHLVPCPRHSAWAELMAQIREHGTKERRKGWSNPDRKPVQQSWSRPES
ncbi:hypothetical protein I302_101689 [Kwoniella bestiolae CBS 10118]|uniref:Uncharacterized protein n=1 Tax=Kwoniella bestiolae CBS 10118 TaxID=1296100 RepID=A0A1B9GCY9_9TREE|nr:hypothetical protein I302_00366 [Kwoniella bestiolae CBS 10118]OCF28876.1 hypothetical protein I302_00366 [Kwoniella bestiolae CBS 10118]